MHAYRSHTCGQLRPDHAGQEIRLSGWVHRVRDHGGVLFIDLRDHYGMTQIVADPDSPAFKTAERLRSEWVIRVDGKVRPRPRRDRERRSADGPDRGLRDRDRGARPRRPSCRCPCSATPEYPEEMRLRYRFLDLRRERMHKNIMLRGADHQLAAPPHDGPGLLRVPDADPDRVSPEGARDYLVPRRIHPGKFYALPQAPQQFKQLLMVSGFDRYFQIAPCFRDEDARADRSPGEFYQLDIEMSFVTQEDVFNAVEPVLRGVFEEFGDGLPVTPDVPAHRLSATRSAGTAPTSRTCATRSRCRR